MNMSFCPGCGNLVGMYSSPHNGTEQLRYKTHKRKQGSTQLCTRSRRPIATPTKKD